MSVVPNVLNKKRKKQESKPQSQLNKCLNEKRRREQENIYIEELAELISASTSDMSSLSVKPDKCAILQETVNQIRRIKQEPGQSDELQRSEVSSSKPTILANDIYGPLLLEALDGFLFVVNIDGKIEFVSENITSFLRYTQDDIVDEIIYNIIHPSDRARFSSNLLPMMSLGNGCNWTTDATTGLSKRGSFNCRFLMKAESGEASMEDKQSSSHLSQYENMQVSAVFFPFARDIGENSEKESGQNRLACVARRIPPNEKSPTSLGVEQFTTRLDVTGKITAVDISGVSTLYSQYLNKELVDRKFQDLCHPSDAPKFVQHIKDTIQSSSNNTTIVYKLRVGPDRYVPVQTKSKHFHFKQSPNEQEFIMSTHSIIRESDNVVPAQTDGNIKGVSTQPSLMSASSSSVASVAPTTSASVAVTVSSLTLPNSYSAFSALSPSNSDLVLGDLMLDIFPNATWNLDQNSVSRESDGVSSPAPNVVCTMATAINSAASGKLTSGQATNSAFSPEVTTVRSSSANSSPATPGRVPTPFSRGTGAFSPSPVQVISGKVSPLSGSSSKTDKHVTGATDVVIADVPTSAAKPDVLVNVQANQKLRNLLMQSNNNNNNNNSNVEGSGQSNQKQNPRDEEVVILTRGTNVFEARAQLPRPVAAVVGVPQAASATICGNNILRELLNQDDEDVLSEGRIVFNDRNASNRLSGILLNSNAMINKSETERQKRLNDNNMLRRLLNNTFDSDNANKSEDIIHQLLKSDAERNVAMQQANRMVGDGQRVIEDSTPKSISLDTSLASSSSSATYIINDSIAHKRKSANNGDFQPKRQTVAHHAHLAGQNPMLASMLAQTPRTPPSVPTSIVNTIMTQLPQERLPKNLEKKLIHTPYTTASATSSGTVSQSFAVQSTSHVLLTSASIQQDIVTSDARGHITHHPSVNLQNLQSGLGKPSFHSQQQQQQQGFLNKILSGNIDGTLLSRSLSAPSTSVQQVIPNSFGIQLTQTVADGAVARGLRDMLSESVAVDVNLAVAGTSQTSDPGLAEILDQIYSLQEEMNVETTIGDEASDILKILEDVMDTSTVATLTPVHVAAPTVATGTVQDISEKIAISAIQKQLMSFEGAAPNVQGNSVSLQNPHIQAYSQSGSLPNQVIRKVGQIPISLAPSSSSAFAALQQGVNRSQPPTYTNSLVAGRVRLPSGAVMTSSGAVINNGQQILVQRMGLPQPVGLGANVNQIRRSLIERRQKLYLEQQQKRLLEQQQKQQMTMQTQQPLDIINAQGTASFSENINELLNNTVAPPNVSLQRSTNISEAQLSPRFNANLSGQIPSPVAQPSPSQLSPNQQGNAQSPFSPLSQQPFPSPSPSPVTYQQSRLSPHTLTSFSQGTSSHSSSPVPTSGSRSPHLQQLSPQQGSGASQWSQRVAQNQAANNLLQQNPLLNAQLSQSFNNNQAKYAAQQRQQLAMRSLPSPGAVQNSRNSPFQNQSDRSFSPLSPVAVYQSQSQPQQITIQQQPQQITIQSQPQQITIQNQPQQITIQQQPQHITIQQQPQQISIQQQQQITLQQQQRVQRTLSGPGRLTTIRNAQSQAPVSQGSNSFVGTEPLLSPQPLQSPSFSQSVTTVPVSSYAPTTVSSAGGVTFNVTQDGSFFTFDRQNLPVLTSNINSERVRVANNAQVSSDYIRQELRAIVGARTQQLVPSQLQGLSNAQTILATTSASGSSINLHALSRNTLEELGLSIEQLPSDAHLNVQSFPHALLSIAGDGESSSTQVNVPNSRAEEPKPADQKKSLLQQLLSEPT